MTLVVSDTAPLNYLIQIGVEQVLAVLYDRVLIPPAVFNELTAEGTPEKVRRWAEQQHGWLEVCAVQYPADWPNAGIDRGERFSRSDKRKRQDRLPCRHLRQGLLKDREKLLVDVVENARQKCSGLLWLFREQLSIFSSHYA